MSKMSNQLAKHSSQKDSQKIKTATTSALVPVAAYNSEYYLNHEAEDPVQSIAANSSFNTDVDADDQHSLSLEILKQKSSKYVKNLKENYYTFKWLQNQCEKDKTELKQTKDNEICLRNELGSLQRRCSSQKHVIVNLKRELKQVKANSVPKSQYDRFVKQNKGVAKNNRKLRWQNVQLVKENERIQSLEEENQRLKLDTENVQNQKITEAEEVKQKLETENKYLLQKRAIEKDELVRLKSNHAEVVKKLNIKLDMKNDDIENLLERNKILQKDLDQIHDNLTYELERAGREKSTVLQLSKVVKKFSRKIENQKYQIRRKSQRISNLKRELIETNNVSEQKVKENEQHQEKVDLIRTQLESLKNLKPEMLQNMKSQEETQNLLKNQLKKFEEKFIQMENIKELEQLQKQVEDCLKKLKVKEEKILAQNRTISSKQSCIDALRETILKLESDVQTKDKNGAAQDTEIRKLSKRLEFVQKENQKQNLTIIHLQKELTESKAHFLTISQQRPPNELLWVRDTEIARLNCVIKGLCETNGKLEEENAEKSKNIEDLRKKLEYENTLRTGQTGGNQEEMIASLKNELNILKKHYDELSKPKSIADWNPLSTFQIEKIGVPNRRCCGTCGLIIN